MTWLIPFIVGTGLGIVIGVVALFGVALCFVSKRADARYDDV